MFISNTALHKLNTVLIALHDSQHAYQTCAKETTNLEFAGWLSDLANKRSRMAMDIEHLITSCGQEPTKRGSLPGVIQQLWINVKSMVAEPTREILMPEIKCSEVALMETYHEVLKEFDLLVSVINLLNQQLEDICSELTRLEGTARHLSSSTFFKPKERVKTEA